jgi:hypothetical protein
MFKNCAKNLESEKFLRESVNIWESVKMFKTVLKIEKNC